jgi:hypothetical protein
MQRFVDSTETATTSKPSTDEHTIMIVDTAPAVAISAGTISVHLPPDSAATSSVQFALPSPAVCADHDVRYLTSLICAANHLPDWPHELRRTDDGRRLDRSARINTCIHDGMHVSASV